MRKKGRCQVMENRMSISFSAMGSNEFFARASVGAFVSVLDPTVEELTEIKTGVSEAVSNSIIHGYGEDPAGMVQVECSFSESRLVKIVIVDQGRGIEDVEKAMEPMYTTGRPEERSGMGFTVMESFMDKVKVESEAGKGTRVTLVKQLDSPGE